MNRFKFTLAGIAVVAIASLAAFAACNDDSTTPVTVSTPTASAPPPTDLPFDGTRERIEEFTDIERITSSTVQLVEVIDGGSFDSLKFTFKDGIPDYTIEYVDSPIACGSGLPVEVAGAAFLEIRMSPTAAHDEDGVETITIPDILFELPTLLQLTMTCDFEGQVIWVAGLSEEVNFRAGWRTGSLLGHFIIIDVNHPGRD